METFWFAAMAGMLAVYTILDGFDLGAGFVHWFGARNEDERRQVLAAIGPVWDGNEVWLLAAGGTMAMAFPRLYASSFSGFYLPLNIVLWLLILRGIAIEFRNHLKSAVWTPFWDSVFAGSSLALALFYGAALGNVVRGVPLSEEGDFFVPLWTNFLPSGATGVLDWYTILIGLFATAALSLHGALWVSYKTQGELSQRSRELAARLWFLVAAFTVVVTLASFLVQPRIGVNFAAAPWGAIFPLLAVAGLFFAKDPKQELRSFLGSCGFLAGMLASAAFGIFPYVLPSSLRPELGLTAFNTATGSYGLNAALWWFVPGMALAVAYAVFLYRRFAEKVS